MNFFEADLTSLHLLQLLCGSTCLYRFLISGSHVRFKMIERYTRLWSVYEIQIQPSDACARHMATRGGSPCFSSRTNVFVSIWDGICTFGSVWNWYVSARTGGMTEHQQARRPALCPSSPRLPSEPLQPCVHASPLPARFRMYRARGPRVVLTSIENSIEFSPKLTCPLNSLAKTSPLDWKASRSMWDARLHFSWRMTRV